MVMQNKALICALYVLINRQYASNMHATKDYRIPKTCHSYIFEWGKMQR